MHTAESLASKNQAERRDYLRKLSSDDLDAFASEHQSKLALVNRRRRISENGLRTRLTRLEDDIRAVRNEASTANTPAKALDDYNVLDFIAGEALDTSEIAEAFKTTNAKALRILNALEKAGHVQREDSNVDSTSNKTISGGRSSISDLVWTASNRDESHADRMKRLSASKPSSGLAYIDEKDPSKLDDSQLAKRISMLKLKKNEAERSLNLARSISAQQPSNGKSASVTAAETKVAALAKELADFESALSNRKTVEKSNSVEDNTLEALRNGTATLDNTPEDNPVRKAIEEFTSNKELGSAITGVSRIRDAMRDAADGKSKNDEWSKYADTLKHALDTQKPDAPVLYRGLKLDADLARKQFKKDTIVKMELASFADDEESAKIFIGRKMSNNATMLTVESGSRSLPIVGLSEFDDEREYLGMGEYEVISNEQDEKTGIVHIRLRQVNTDQASGSDKSVAIAEPDQKAKP